MYAKDFELVYVISLSSQYLTRNLTLSLSFFKLTLSGPRTSEGMSGYQSWYCYRASQPLTSAGKISKNKRVNPRLTVPSATLTRPEQ